MDPANSTAYAATEAGFYSFVNVSLAVVYYISYPVGKLLYIVYLVVLAVLAPAWGFARFVLSPFTHMASTFVYAASLPLSLISKLETVYVFLSTAVLIGLFTGAILFAISSTAINILRLDAESSTSNSKPLRTVVSYREGRSKRKGRAPTTFPGVVPAPLSPVQSLPSPVVPLTPTGLDQMNGRGRPRSLLSSTILEEDDSDESETAA